MTLGRPRVSALGDGLKEAQKLLGSRRERGRFGGHQRLEGGRGVRKCSVETYGGSQGLGGLRKEAET